MARRGERVLEVGRTRRERRSHAKTDALDALRAAGSVLGEAKLASPCAAGEREALRALMVARAGALAAKEAGLCQLRAPLVTCPEPLRSELRSLKRARLLRRLQAVRPDRHPDAELRGTLIALRALARRVQALTAEERELKGEIQALVTRLAPALLDEPGIGPASAAQVLSWSHHGRFRSEAAFARLAGAAPIPASPGLVLRHRLDCSGRTRERLAEIKARYDPTNLFGLSQKVPPAERPPPGGSSWPPADYVGLPPACCLSAGSGPRAPVTRLRGGPW